MAGYTADALSVEWCTEDRICERLPRVFGGPPSHDPCSNPYSHVGAVTSYTLEKGNDGLIDPWGTSNFVNPPFGRAWFKLLPSGRREYIFPDTYKLLTPAQRKEWTPVSIANWIKRCANEGKENSVIGLMPVSTGTKAWQRYVWPHARAIFFPEGRLHFRLVFEQPDGSTIEKSGPAPMDCALPLWTPSKTMVDRFVVAFGDLGFVNVLR